MPRRVLRSKAALCAAVILAACATTTSASPPAEPRRPDIIVILADDLGYADTSLYPGGRIETPNLDRLARQGVLFEQGYVASPVCSPSRAALMTGRYSQRFGFEHNAPRGGSDGLDPAEATIGTVLQSAGYRTGAIGKWHLGFGAEHYPTRRGFDTFWGFLTGQTNYIDPRSPGVVNAVEPQETQGEGNIVAPARRQTALNRIIEGDAKTPVEVGGRYLTDALTDEAIRFVDADDGRPFFLYLAHLAPHSPLQAPKSEYDSLPMIKDHQARVYAAMVRSLDANVGRLLDHLDRTGRADNTLIIFLSDNGCAAYLTGLCSPQPLSGSKLTHLEGGIRVPFIMKWPARLGGGIRHKAPVSSLDILPTAAAAAGVTLPTERASDGRDLMVQVAEARPARSLFWRNTPVASVRSGDWKYYRDYDGREHLYNLRQDPKEAHDLAAIYPRRVAALRSELAAWEADKSPPRWTTEPITFTFGGRTFRFRP